jgi:hypothetical protein
MRNVQWPAFLSGNLKGRGRMGHLDLDMRMVLKLLI